MTTTQHSTLPASTTVTEVVLPGLVPPSGLKLQQRALPAPGPGHALIRIEATGISFAEQGMRRGRYPGQPAFPFVPGYDVIGTVHDIGHGVNPALIGTRIAAATRTGGWATHAVIPAADLVPVPSSLDPADAETVIVNGITAWQMLHRRARAQPGQTVLVHGANGGVGTVLVQLARHAGIRVIGTAAPRHHEALRGLGAEPLDSSAQDLAEQVRALAPDGVHAAFDHLGLVSARRSFTLLARNGALIVYGMAADLDGDRPLLRQFANMLGQIALWNITPNRRRASFYDFWGGKTLRPAAFRRTQHADLTQVLDLLANGIITPRVAARFPLVDVVQAMELAESRTVMGKVVLLP